MILILKATLQKKNIISLCVGKVDWDKRIIGYVKSITQAHVIINVVDIYGTVFKCKKIAIANIALLEINDSYAKHLERLKKQGKAIKGVNPLYYYNRGNRFYEKLEALRFKGNVCTFFFGTEYATGVVKKIDQGFLFINSIGYRGTNEGETCCRLESITKVRYEGPLEKKISYLRKG